MFASPAIRVFSQENASAVPKKPGVTSSVSRKPFNDRTVNGASPGINKILKSDFKIDKESSCSKAPPEDDLFFYDSYSYKDMEDNYLDIKCLTQKETLNILQAYCNYPKTKTPIPDLSTEFEMFIDIPESNIYFKCGESFEDKVLEENLGDVSLPSIDLDDDLEV